MTGNAPDRGFSELLGLSNRDFDGPDFSRLVLTVLLKLDADFPSRTDLTGCPRIAANETAFGQLWDWLASQGIVSGPLSNCALTLSGKQSFGTAIDAHPTLSAQLLHSENGLEGEEATKMLLAVIRHHFEHFGRRGGKS